MRILLCLLLLSAAACTPVQKVVEPQLVEVEAPAPEPAWAAVATIGDRQRLDSLQAAWQEAIDQVGRRRYARALRDEGELLEPDAALPRPAPPPGPYLCRTIKLGLQGRRGPTYTAYRSFFCYVEAEEDVLTFVKQTGSQRPAGRFYTDTDGDRLVFLGTMALGPERDQLPYGADPDRDMAGVVERVAPFRYRLVIPHPRFESTLDVIELIPFVDLPVSESALLY